MDIEERVKKALDEIRVQIQSHGGDVEFVSVDDDNIVKVTLSGACGGCPMAAQTLKNVVESYVRQQVPEVKAVEGA